MYLALGIQKRKRQTGFLLCLYSMVGKADVTDNNNAKNYHCGKCWMRAHSGSATQSEPLLVLKPTPLILILYCVLKYPWKRFRALGMGPDKQSFLRRGPGNKVVDSSNDCYSLASMAEELKFSFYVILINLSINWSSHMWLVAGYLTDSAGLGSKLSFCRLLCRVPFTTRMGNVYSGWDRFLVTHVVICFGFAWNHKALSNSEVLVEISETYWEKRRIFYF